MCLVDLAGSGALNDLFVHPRMLEFVRVAMQSDDVWHRGTDFGRPDASRVVMVISFKLAGAEWFGYDAFPRLGSDSRFSKFLAGKTPDEVALFGIPRPGHRYWNAATIDAMARRHGGLDMSPWLEALPTGR